MVGLCPAGGIDSMRLRVTARGFTLRAFVLGLVVAVGGALPASAEAPTRPTDLGLEAWGPGAADGLPCATGPDRPVVATSTPRLRARVFAETGVVSSAFRVYTGTVEHHTWNGEDLDVDLTTSGTFAERTVPEGWLADGGVYTWQAWQGGPAGISDFCEFEVDTTRPNTPTASSTDYPTGVVSGGVGEPGAFTFGANGSTDVVGYEWSTFGSRGTVDAPGGTATATIAPTKVGVDQVTVTAFDRAGNRSATSAVHGFTVAAATPSTGLWKLDGTGADSSGADHPLTLEGGAAFGAGYAGDALVLDGATAFAATESAVVDSAKPFSVSAWVKLADSSTSRTVASQDGGFALRYDAGVDRWTMAGARSAIEPEVGAWTHLVGVHVPTKHQFLLYVNGKLEGTATGDLGATTGPLVVGAGQVAGVRAEHFAGAIDDVRTWARPVTTAEVTTAATRSDLRARYSFSETAGTTTRDLVSGTEGVLSGGVTFASGRRDRWAAFDGTGRVTAPLPADVRANRSYSVSVWVLANAFDGTAVTASGLPFSLGYSEGFWAFSVPQADGTVVRATSFAPAETGRWTHLAGIHNAVTGQNTLYVNGSEKSSVAAPTDSASAPSNGLLIGDGWQGDLDDVTVHVGALDDVEVLQMYSSTLHR
jgi:concanavalin A-like lectin/glucanase superfamily protein